MKIVIPIIIVLLLALGKAVYDIGKDDGYMAGVHDEQERQQKKIRNEKEKLPADDSTASEHRPDGTGTGEG